VLSKVRSVLSADEADVPLRAALNECIEHANKLMLEQGAPPKRPEETGRQAPAMDEPARPAAPAPSKVVGRRQISNAKADETKRSVQELNDVLAKRPDARVNLSWEVIEE
jgi:hypothetical protein